MTKSAEGASVTGATQSVGSLRTRSPNYPIYGIETALRKVEVLANDFKRFRVPLSAATEKLGFKSPASSAAAQAIAALRAYGFIEVHGSGDSRQVAVSEIAHKILGNHADRPQLLKQAALAPSIHRELFGRFMSPDGLAPDAAISQYLKFDRQAAQFNPEVVDVLIRQFRGTLAFVGINSSGSMSGEKPESSADQVEVGDLVQWESQGVAQFPAPRRVSGLSDDGQWVFVDGNATGIPIDQVKVEKKASEVQMTGHNNATSTTSAVVPPPNPAFQATPPPAPPPTDARQYAMTTDTGEVVVRWPAVLSAEDFESVEAWLEILKKKIKRSVKADGTDEPN